jgi:hypothetical protein
MSKLIQRIERLGKDTPSPLGFGAATRRKAAPTMVLIGSINNLKAINKLEGVFMDGVLFSTGSSNTTDLAKASSVLRDIPWGYQLENPTSDQVKELVEAGCDFITVTGLAAPLEALHNDDLGKFLIVPSDIKEEHAHSLEVLPIDAVVYAEAVSSPLNLESLLKLAAVRGEIGSAFLVPVKGPLSAWELECLRDIGIEGVIIDLASTDADGLKNLGQTILDLPRRRPRNEMLSPSLPRVSAHAQVMEDDDDEGDDDSA